MEPTLSNKVAAPRRRRGTYNSSNFQNNNERNYCSRHNPGRIRKFRRRRNLFRIPIDTSANTSVGESTVVTNMPPGLAPIVGTQCIMGQGGIPYFQQPMFNEDIQQRLAPHISTGYYEMGDAAPTTREQYNMNDGRFAQADNSSPVQASSISQQSGTQTQPPVKNPTIPPAYAYGGSAAMIPGNYQYPTPALYPVAAGGTTSGLGSTNTGDYGKGPNNFAGNYGGNYENNQGSCSNTTGEFKTSTSSGPKVQPTQSTNPSSNSDLVNIYSKSLSKSNEKQGFLYTTPPPFNLGSQNSGMGPGGGSPQHLSIPAMTPHHNTTTLMHQPIHQSNEKQGFHYTTPPPFNLGSQNSGMGPGGGSPQHLSIPAMTPHHNTTTLMHQPIHQSNEKQGFHYTTPPPFNLGSQNSGMGPGGGSPQHLSIPAMTPHHNTTTLMHQPIHQSNEKQGFHYTTPPPFNLGSQNSGMGPGGGSPQHLSIPAMTPHHNTTTLMHQPIHQSNEKQGFHYTTPPPFNLGSQNSGMGPGGGSPQHLSIPAMTPHHNTTTLMHQPIHQSNEKQGFHYTTPPPFNLGSQNSGMGPGGGSPQHLSIPAMTPHHNTTTLMHQPIHQSNEKQGFQYTTPPPFNLGSQNSGMGPGGGSPQHLSIPAMTPHHNTTTLMHQPIHQSNEKQGFHYTTPPPFNLGSQNSGMGPGGGSPQHLSIPAMTPHHNTTTLMHQPIHQSNENQGFHYTTPPPFNLGSQNSGMGPGGGSPQHLSIPAMTPHHNTTTLMHQPIHQSNEKQGFHYTTPPPFNLGSQNSGMGPGGGSPQHLSFPAMTPHHNTTTLMHQPIHQSYEKQGFHYTTPPPFNLGSQNSGMSPGGGYPQHLSIPAMTPHHNTTTLMHQPINQNTRSFEMGFSAPTTSEQYNMNDGRFARADNGSSVQASSLGQRNGTIIMSGCTQGATRQRKIITTRPDLSSLPAYWTHIDRNYETVIKCVKIEYYLHLLQIASKVK